MTKPRRRNLSARPLAPLPAERVAQVAWVWNSHTGRLVAPWVRHPLWPDEEAQLLAVMARVDRLRPAGVVWLWPDDRPPVPVNPADPNWVHRWEGERAVYVRR